jgi:hypothetical protein
MYNTAGASVVERRRRRGGDAEMRWENPFGKNALQPHSTLLLIGMLGLGGVAVWGACAAGNWLFAAPAIVLLIVGYLRIWGPLP